MVTRQDIVNKAREYLGTPFHLQGRLKGIGIDCVGLVIGVATELDILPEGFVDFRRYSLGEVLKGTLIQQLDTYLAKQTRDPLPGDVVTFRFLRCKNLPQHVAIYTDHGIIHVSEHLKRVTEHRFDAMWRNRLVSTYSFEGLDDNG